MTREDVRPHVKRLIRKLKDSKESLDIVKEILSLDPNDEESREWYRQILVKVMQVEVYLDMGIAGLKEAKP